MPLRFAFAGSAKNSGVGSANIGHPGEGAGAAAENGGAQRVAGEQRDDRQADTDFGEQIRQGDRLLTVDLAGVSEGKNLNQIDYQNTKTTSRIHTRRIGLLFLVPSLVCFIFLGNYFASD